MMSLVSSSLGSPGAVGAATPPTALDPLPARRASAPGWRDPRLWLGVALVAASVLVGVRVLASADDTVAVWAVAADVGAGDRLDEGDLTVARVRFAEDEAVQRYVQLDETLPADLRLVRALGAGELLPRAAIGSDDEAGTVEISLAVDPLRMPTSVGPGSVVDVYLHDGSGSRRGVATSEPALGAVGVVDAPRGADGLGVSGERQLVLAVDERTAPEFYALLASLSDPVVYVVRR